MLSQFSDASSSYPTSIELQQPSLNLLNSLLTSVTTALERAAEEKSLLLNKVKMKNQLLSVHSPLCFYLDFRLMYSTCGLQIGDINELSRQEVDEIINMCVQEDSVSSSDNIQKRLIMILCHSRNPKMNISLNQ